jgi:hypothetical protein
LCDIHIINIYKNKITCKEYVKEASIKMHFL